MAIQREYKDRLFVFIFGQEENRAWTLSLYNAINESHYTDPNLIEFTTLRSILYMGMHNDVSFIIDNQMNLYEQQSSYNPNMPLRQHQYVGHLFEQYIKKNKINIFSEQTIPLPVPKLVVFYNGQKNQPDEKWLYLSDAFPKGAKSDVEVKVRMLNIHYHRNQKLLEACKPLLEYSWLIDSINANKEALSLDDAVNAALRDMPQDALIKPFLIIHQAEVLGMLHEEYDEAAALELIKDEYIQIGKKEGLKEGLKEGKIEWLKEGLKEGKIRTTIEFIKDGILTMQYAAKKLDITVEQLQLYMEQPELCALND